MYDVQIKAETDTGESKIIKVNNFGSLVPIDFLIETARNNIKGAKIERILARNTDVDLVEEDLWFAGGVESYLTSAETMSVVSSSANDTSAGTGARTVKLYGLDGSYNEFTETLVLNGTTTVITSNNFLRINKVDVVTAGSSGTSAGAISFTASTSLSTHANIPAGENRTGKSQFTIPAGKTGYLLDFLPSLAAGKTGCDVVFKARPLNEVFRMVSRLAVQSTGTSALNHALHYGPPKFPAKTDLKVTATGAANDQDIYCEYILLLIDD